MIIVALIVENHLDLYKDNNQYDLYVFDNVVYSLILGQPYFSKFFESFFLKNQNKTKHSQRLKSIKLNGIYTEKAIQSLNLIISLSNYVSEMSFVCWFLLFVCCCLVFRFNLINLIKKNSLKIYQQYNHHQRQYGWDTFVLNIVYNIYNIFLPVSNDILTILMITNETIGNGKKIYMQQL